MISTRHILGAAIQRLTAAGCATPRLDAELLLAHALGQERTWLYLYPEKEVASTALNEFEALLRRREQREPVAYLTGHKEFFGLDFAVNPHVLIPRPETELLVETALELSIVNYHHPGEHTLSITNYQDHKGTTSPITIADVGTGSGCIAVALAKHLPQAAIFAIDLSPEALKLAQHNTRRHGVDNQITFLLGHLLESLPQPVDLLVSNPPYVSRPELVAAQPEVSQFEPRLALDGGPDGLQVIRQLLSQAKAKLKPGASLLIEIGSAQGQAVRQLAGDHFPEATIQIKPDLAGLDRLLVVKM
jgi:release factor glutamine methyltransferase